MPSGYNTTTNFTDSLQTMVAAARVTREYEGVMAQLVDVETLEEGTGLTWNEVTLGKLTAQSISETTELDNPQQASDTNFPLTPSIVGIHTVITDRVKRRISSKVYAKLGQLGQNAIQRKKDTDGLLILDGGTSLGGAGTTLVSGLIAAAKYRISSNATEPGRGPYRCALHGFQIKDLHDELVAGVGTYNVQEGPTASVFKSGFTLPIAGVEVYEDGNITIDSSDDAKGGVFTKEGVVLVRGKSPWSETRREPHIGGGADSVFLYDEYIFGERLAAATTSAFVFEIYTDATAPTG